MKRLLTGVVMFGTAAALAIAGEPEPSLASRDAVWRSIFVRPVQNAAPVADPANDAKVALGALLFTDTRLSGDGRRACASCHDPARGFTDGLAKAQARDGSALKRNAPSLFNLAWAPHFFADGRAATLEDQARVPITAADEMAGDFATITARLSADAEMAGRFAKSFPSKPEVNETHVLAALATYERTLVSPETRFDQWVKGDDAALTPQEREGFSLFVGKGGCVGCHGGWRFTDDGLRDIGLPGEDPGRSAIVGSSPELRQFKTPGLRELMRTAPYMHDGSLATLRDVIDHYTGGFVKRPSLDSNLVRDLRLADPEKEALIAFLKALSSQD
jgi:cytochrome c peroxidase